MAETTNRSRRKFQGANGAALVRASVGLQGIRAMHLANPAIFNFSREEIAAMETVLAAIASRDQEREVLVPATP